MEVVGRVSGRRRWSVEQKLGILREAFGPGASVRDALDRYEIGSGLLYTWRRLALAGQLMPGSARRFAEVTVADPVRSFASAGGLIAIDLPTGVRISVDPQVDADALARVLGVLAR